MKLNDIVQWAGTCSFLVMYTLMSVFPQYHPLNIVAGAVGAVLYLIWSIRVVNKPQMLTNVAGLSICLVGLFKAWG
jgi:hypothetical protein